MGICLNLMNPCCRYNLFRDAPRTYTAAAAEAFVADYMRTMQHQLPPLPYVPPPGLYSGSSYDQIPPPPRYYEGLPLPDYSASSRGGSYSEERYMLKVFELNNSKIRDKLNQSIWTQDFLCWCNIVVSLKLFVIGTFREINLLYLNRCTHTQSVCEI